MDRRLESLYRYRRRIALGQINAVKFAPIIVLVLKDGGFWQIEYRFRQDPKNIYKSGVMIHYRAALVAYGIYQRSHYGTTT